jgi:hypothetical protein
MPIITQTLRVQLGRQTPLVQTTPLTVDKLEEITLSVPGVTPEKPAKGKKAAKPKAVKNIQLSTVTPKLANVKFVAIFDGGQGNGVKIKIGKDKAFTLKDPVIFTGPSASRLSKNSKFVLENESLAPKHVVLVVGSNMNKSDKKVEKKGVKIQKPAQ